MGRGTKVLGRLSRVLKQAIPDLSGLSARNLMDMRQFAGAWPDRAIVQAVLAQLPWYHNLARLEKMEDPGLRLWYGEKALQLGLSRDLLVTQIESRLHEREGHAQHNFADTLPPVPLSSSWTNDDPDVDEPGSSSLAQQDYGRDGGVRSPFSSGHGSRCAPGAAKQACACPLDQPSPRGSGVGRGECAREWGGRAT